MTTPRVSVVLSVHNGARFLEEAVESILAQTFTNFEFIIVDDGSTDQTAGILQKVAADPRVKVITQERRGLTASLNRAIQASVGEYIARMDADDVAAPERLEAQLEYLEKHPETAVVGSLGSYIDEAGSVVGEKNLPTEPSDIKKKILWNNQCIHSSLVFRASVLKEVGGYDESFPKSQDYDLLLRLMREYEVTNLPNRLISWRVRRGSISWSSKRQEWDALRARWRAITRYGYPVWYGCLCLVLRATWLLFPQGIKFLRYARQSHHSHR